MLFCRLADALYLFLSTSQSQRCQGQPNTSLLSLLVLVKGVIKAAILLKADKKAVKELVLTPSMANPNLWGPLNLLEVGQRSLLGQHSLLKTCMTFVVFLSFVS